ncbi:glycoside hydrolase family 3 C-terminal domain-containing protein [Hoylesella buccalis]|nr:beta-glucosidase [Hoylesella buccalis]UEA64215.1 glycoside hydrolase family 3 C-terminal domain-containing protein [Hoylesella buccalis]UWP50879.1 glycoside hydrolase family 3 C-terminal domain-containing protein [Hoylesella buccalis ATCC 35310]
MKHILIVLLGLAASCGNVAWAQKPNQYSAKLKFYNLPKNKIYHKGWIDYNKNGKKDVYEDPTAGIDERIDDLISQMTLEEKTCQMVTLYGYKRVLQDDLPNESWKQKLWKDGIGAIDEHLNGFQEWGLPPSDNPWVWPASKHAWAINEVQRFFVEQTRLGIPVDFTNEGIRGVESFKATNFPTQLGLGTTWNRKLIHQVGYITGREARLLGYTNVYAPILDVGRDQRWGRYEEVYGESPFLVAELGIQMTRGLQTNYQVASTGKHFAAYSNNKGAREGMARVDPQMSPREVQNIHLYPWGRVVREAGLLGAMSSYNDYDGVPIQGSFHWLTEVLRQQFGFKGYVVSDSDALEYLFSKHRTAANMKEAVYKAVMAGLNVRCTFRSPDSFVLPLRELVKEGRIPMKVIDERLRDILRVKFMVGIFDRPYQMNLQAADKEVDGESHQQVALQASRESIVLLKNQNNTLPLTKASIKKIAVCGPNANDATYALTHYGPLAVEVTTVFEGIRNKVGSEVEVTYTKGCDLVDAHWPESELVDYPMTADEQNEIDKAVEQVRQSDVAVVVLGGNSRTCGENKSRSSLELPGRQLQLLKAVQATGKTVILVLINGRPLSVNWADKFVPAIVEAWYPGSQGGTAVADVLFGDYNPGGKLTVTFPKTVGQIPFNFPSKPAALVDGGNKLGLHGNASRTNSALYYFGHGLSYTTFKYSNLRLSAQNISPTDSVVVSCDITNTGKRAGDEVVQLYIQDVLSTVTTYEKNLRGFERVHLKPGETRTLSFVIKPEHLQLINEQYQYVVEPGDFKVMMGASSEDIRLEDTFTVIESNASIVAKNRAHRLDVVAVPATPTAQYAVDGNTSTYWQGQTNASLTVSVPASEKLGCLTIVFAKGCSPDAEFTIQLSSGGGQFLDVFTGKVSGHEQKLQINRSGVSDIRVLCQQGTLNIAEIKVDK